MYRLFVQRRLNAIGIYILISLCFTAILTLNVNGQSINFSDSFSDGDFYNKPAWSGADSLYKIVKVSDNSLLQLDAANDDDGDAYLSSPSTQTIGFWEFYLNMDFAPSGSNYALIYLMSNRSDLDGPVDGYALRAGERGSDDKLHLIRLDNGIEAETLITGQLPIGEGGGYRVRINRAPDGTWTLQEAAGYNGLLSPEQGSITEITHTESTHFGVRTLFTRTRADKFSFDFKITFSALSCMQMSDLKLQTVFSAAVNQSSVNKANFYLEDIGSPSEITFQSDSVLNLEFTLPIPRGDYLLHISDIEGSTGQTFEDVEPLNVSIFDAYRPGDVVINEFMYKPPAGSAEYVELKNTSAQKLNLDGWYLQDNRDTRKTIAAETSILEPDSFVVISGDTSALYNTFGKRHYVQMANFPALNDAGGDAIRVYDRKYRKVDSLAYTSDWGGNRVALERIHANLPSSNATSWRNSTAPNGGTPGKANSQGPIDTTAPSLINLQVTDSTTIRLIFSESLNNTAATDLNNFTIIPAISIERLEHQRDTVDIVLSQPMSHNTEYQIIVNSMEDLFSNLSPILKQSLTYYRFTKTAPGDVVINEFLYKGAPEFVELYNQSDKTINLKGWTLADGNSNVDLSKKGMPAKPNLSIAYSIPLLPESYVVLTGDGDLASANHNAYYLKNFPSLNNSREPISIHDETNTTIDSLYYDKKQWYTAQNQSLERKDPGAASGDPSNWNRATDTHSPGKQNSNYEIDTKPPEIKFANILPDSTIEVQFSEFITNSTDSWDITFKGSQLSVIEFNERHADRLVIESHHALFADRSRELIVENISDSRGNRSPKLSVPVAWPLEAGSVIINEILPDPLSDNRDYLPDQAEYVELYNRNDYAVSLEGIYLHDEPDENNHTRDLHPISTEARWIPARSYALVHASPNADATQAPVIRFFNIASLSNNCNILIKRGSLSLNQKQDAIYLADSTGTTIDSVFYRESWHNPNLIDTKGLSIERISPNLPSGDPNNWSTSTHRLGGTPAAPNSIYIRAGPAASNNSIRFSPNPFSPDGDGYEDHLIITYRLDAPDYLLRARIFDRHGRLVRKLADAKAAGFEGQLVWEGRNEQGNDLRIGIYIVLLEAYNSTSGEDRAFKKTVVVARKL